MGRRRWRCKQAYDEVEAMDEMEVDEVMVTVAGGVLLVLVLLLGQPSDTTCTT